MFRVLPVAIRTEPILVVVLTVVPPVIPIYPFAGPPVFAVVWIALPLTVPTRVQLPRDAIYPGWILLRGIAFVVVDVVC